MATNSVELLERVVALHAQSSQLERVSEEAAAELRKEFPQIPEDYIQTLRCVGFGSYGPHAFSIYGGPIEPGEIFDSKTAKSMEGILFVGDDLSGWMFGYETSTDPWRMRLFDHSNIMPLAPEDPVAFPEFLAAELRRGLEIDGV